MNRRHDQWVAYLLVAVFAALSLSALGEWVRKNDQVAILSGAIDLSRGHLQAWSHYYQYDKCYVLYWLLAGLFKLMPAVSPIVLGNAGGCVLFWGALVWFVRSQAKPSVVALLAFCAAPAVLFNAVYVNSSVCASAFLLLAVALLNRRSRVALAGAGLALFAATGSRIDIVLLLPFLVWNYMPASFFGVRMFRWKKMWVMVGSVLAALGWGWMQRATPTVMIDPILNVKVLAGYTVFGFGAMVLLYFCAVVMCAGAAWRCPRWGRRLFYLGGAVALLLPVLFYAGQLHTPRYFFRVCEATLLFFCSRRGRVLFTALGWRKPMLALTSVGCITPLVLGLNVSELNHPKLTLRNATCVPSGDGYYPMGAYLDFMGRLRRAEHEPIDHNQLVWQAVQSAELDFSAEPIPVLWSPMFGYFMLRASLENGVAECRGLADWGARPFYAETRTWMRADPKFGQAELSDLLRLPSESASDDFEGIEVRRFGKGDTGWAVRTQFLNHLFQGNEYRLYAAESLVGQPWPSRRRVLFSKSRASLQWALDAGRVVRHAFGAYFYTEACPKDFDVVWNRSSVMAAVAVYPDWMSFQAYDAKVTED